MSSDGFLAILCWTSLVFVLGLWAGATIDIPASHAGRAREVCAVNGGVSSFDRRTATCLNGAKFTMERTP